ncbi:MAG: Rab family GTPase [Legionellales bacterium]|jgi:small GTP-binding protein
MQNNKNKKQEVEISILCRSDNNGGSTSLLDRFIKNEFRQNTSLTIAVTHYEKIKEIDGITVKYMFKDGAGQERYDSTVRKFAGNCMGLMLCISPTKDFKYDWIDRTITFVPKDAPIFLVITKSDLKYSTGEDFDETIITSLEKKYPNYPLFITSAKDNHNVDQAFDSIMRKTLEFYQEKHLPQTKNPLKITLTPKEGVPTSPGILDKITKWFSGNNSESSQQTLANNNNAPLLTNPVSQQYNVFLEALSPSSLQQLKTLEKQGVNLNQVLPILTTLQASQQDLTQRLSVVETQTGLDEQTLKEIAYIQENKHLNLYYQAFKTIFGQTLFAAQVISSTEVDATNGMATNISGGISTLAGGLCPPAAPFLSFAALVVEAVDSRNNLIAMKKLSGWAGLDEMAFMAATLARYFTFALKASLENGLPMDTSTTFSKIKENCNALLTRIKSGEILSAEEIRATLDAKKLLSYMKENARPSKINTSDCVIVLLRVIMGNDYNHSSIQSAVVIQQTTSTITTATQSLTITLEAWETMQKKTAEAERKADEAQRQLEILRKQTTQSNPHSSHAVDNGDGTVSLQSSTQVNTAQGVMPVGATLESLQRQLAELQDFVNTAVPILDSFREQQQSGQKNDDKDMKVRQELFQGKSFNNQ